MTVDAHVAQLSRRHTELETKINAEQSRPGPDEIKLAALKRKKLRLKDEIQRLQH